MAMNIEPLEARIAPASLVGGKLTYTDTDGDLVTITLSKKTGLTETDFVFDTAFSSSGPQKLLAIDLAGDTALTGTNITMKVAKVGDGLVNVGAILASGINLGAVTLLGDLRQIEVGDNAPKATAIKALTVKSFGLQGASLATVPGQQLPPELVSTINGKFGKITIAGDFEHARLQVFNFGAVKSAAFSLGGTLIGGEGNGEGVIELGPVTTVKVGGVKGGTAPDPDSPSLFGSQSGILRMNAVTSLTIAGDIEGGNFPRSGSVRVGEFNAKIAKITIGGNVIGGHGERAGHLEITGATALLSVGGLVGGNLTGPTDFVVGGRTGTIETQNDVGVLKVREGLVGGSIPSSGSIFIGGAVKQALLNGNLTGSAGSDTGQLDIGGKLTLLKLTGSLLGGPGEGSGRVSASQIGTGFIVGDLVGTDIVPDNPNTDITGGIVASEIGTLKITGSMKGGAGREYGGSISAGDLKSLTVTGSIEGGTFSRSAQVDVGRLIQGITVLGGIKGGAGEESGSLHFHGGKTVRVAGVVEGGSGPLSGSILAGGTVGAVTVGGLKAGTGILSGSVFNNNGTFKSVLVTGDMIGLPANPAHIGTIGPGGLSIGSVTVLGKVELSRITVGLIADIPSSPDASLGKVTIGKDFIASVIAAGVQPNGDFFADGDDTLATAMPDDPEITARIASVLIKGSIVGTASPTTDSFGIVAQEVVKVTVGKQAVPLAPGKSNDTAGVLIGGTTDVRVREV